MATPSPRKRSSTDAELEVLAGLERMAKDQLESVQHTPKQPTLSQQSSGSSKRSHNTARSVSPAPSTSTLSTLDASPLKPSTTPKADGNPPKRQKLTFAEKEAKKLLRGEEKRQREEIKARKEEERQLRDRERAEEKAQREEKRQAMLVERETKRQAKELQEKAKEEERRAKEEEKVKKERSQLRLNAFFKQPTIPQQESRGSPIRDAATPSSSRRGSVSSTNCPEGTSRDRSASATPQKIATEYERFFPAFFLKADTALAPWNRFSRNEGLEYVRQKVDDTLHPATKTENPPTSEPFTVPATKIKTEESPTAELTPNLTNLLHIASGKVRGRLEQIPTVKEIIAQVQGTSYNPVDLTSSTSQRSRATQTPFDQLKRIPMKSLRFFEDVRPPYIGTCTKLPANVSAAKLGRSPCGRMVPSVDYDYDSEAEWEAPGEGEDLDSEGEDDLEEDEDEDDMKDFVVDEGGTEAKKRTPIIINTEHTSTGICWEDPQGKSRTADAGLAPSIDMNQYKIEMIHDNPRLPIDPYSTMYWTEALPAASISANSMNPPRVPLNAVNRVNQQFPYPTLVNTIELKSGDSVKPASHKPTKPVTIKRFIPTELLDEFKKAVDGNDSTKLGIIEELKKRFPKQSKGAISDTLSAIADRIGPREGEKRWVLKAESRI